MTVDLAAGDCTASFALDHGARLASLTVAGTELLIQPGADPMRWGSYPMVPWAGRISHGRFCFDGTEYRLPTNLAPHAIHGTAYTSRWSADDDGLMRLDLVEPWPFGGTVEQWAELTDHSLTIDLRLTAADQGMPAMLGWHPWFRRSLQGAEAILDINPSVMYELDHELIPTGSLVPPGPPPWDSCFELRRPPTIHWPQVLALELRSDCRCWTVYTEPANALCVEPQTAAPDSFNRVPDVVEPGHSLTARFELHWQRPSPRS